MEYLPLVSIITVVYNGEKKIEQAIQSVLGQSYKNIEYIIIDGGSRDGTMEIVKKYQDRLRWISEKDEGISDAFNKGIKLANGEIIGIINADDWYENEAIENVVKNFQGSDVIYGDMRMWNNDKIEFVVKGNHEILKDEMTVNHPTVFIAKTCYDKFGVFDKSYRCAMDYDLLLRLKVNNCRFRYLPVILANMSLAGFSDKRWMIGCRETLEIKDKYMPNRRVKNHLYFYKHTAAIMIPKFLKKIKLGFIVKMYRSRYSKMKKEYE